MESNDLLTKALADAKKIRATAMANAKAALEETLTPRIQEMIRQKLSEQEEEIDENLEQESVTTEGEVVEEEVNEQSLDEILAELEMEESALTTEGEDSLEESDDNDADDLEEAKKKDKEDKEEEEPAEDEEAEEGGEEGGEEGPEVSADADMDDMGSDEEKEVIELTVDEFKQMIRDAIAEMNGDGGQGQEDPLSLEPEAGATDLGAGEEELEEINLDSVLAELEEEEAGALNEKKSYRGNSKKEIVSLKKKLSESVKAINTLKSELNEINLLNAKLLYVNKIFKEKTLSESQKVRIVDAFDNANTIKEVKQVYEKLKNEKKSTIRSNRSAIKESVGFASKPVGGKTTRPEQIVSPEVERFQRLGGIIND